MHENRETSGCFPSHSGPVGEGRAPHAGRVRWRGVGLRRSTDEAAEQRGASLGGGGGGKGASQGELCLISHASDTERETRVPGMRRGAPRFDAMYPR